MKLYIELYNIVKIKKMMKIGISFFGPRWFHAQNRTKIAYHIYIFIYPICLESKKKDQINMNVIAAKKINPSLNIPSKVNKINKRTLGNCSNKMN